MIAHGECIKIFHCNANKELTKQIADIVGVPAGDSQVGTFSNGEISVNINESVRGCICCSINQCSR